MLAAAERPPWQHPRIVTTLILVFVAGGASGALWMQLDLHKRLHGVSTASSEPTRSAAAKINLQRFQTELNLSTAQSEKIALVLDDFSKYYQELQEQTDDVRATGKTRILQILDPNQRDKFEKIVGDLAPQLDNSK